MSTIPIKEVSAIINERTKTTITNSIVTLRILFLVSIKIKFHNTKLPVLNKDPYYSLHQYLPNLVYASVE